MTAVDLWTARARALALGAELAPGHVEVVPLPDAVGRVLAADAHALVALPSFDSAAMDGWAVAGVDKAWRLVGEPVLAGETAPIAPLAPGEARPVACGAPVPEGTDAVLRREGGTPFGQGVFAVPRAPAAGEHIRRAGSEAVEGEALVSAGDVLTAGAVALLAAAGHDAVEVRRSVPAELLLLGDEVRTSGLPAPGEVRDVFGPVLPGVLARHGATVERAQHVPDDRGALGSRIRSASAPLVITTGGTAHGSRDHLHPVLADLGATLVVDGVDMRPGHPVVVARLPGDRVLLGLPGNPLAAFAALAAIGLPLLDGLLGRPRRQQTYDRLATGVLATGSGVQLVLCTRSPVGLFPVQGQRPHMLRGLAVADVFAAVPATGADEEDIVPTVPLA